MISRKALTLNKGGGLWIALALGVTIIAGLLGTWWTLQRADRQMRDALLLDARLVAQAVNINRVQTLAGSASDLKQADYLRLKEQFSLVRQAHEKCRFIYLLGRKADGKLFIYVDSEPAGSRDYSPPGQIYEEAPESYLRVFDTKIAAVEGPITDRWGMWITALVPVTDPATGKLIAILGMDIDAREWKWDVAVNASLPVFLILTILILLATGLFAFLEQKKHKESETRYQKVIENAGQPIIVIQNGMIKYGNPAIVSILGYSLQETYSKPFRDFIHPDDINMMVDDYQKRINNNQDILLTYKFRVLTKDKGIRWFEINTSMIEWDGNPASLNFLTDLTERMKYDEVLRESENKFRSIFENTQDVYYQTDLEGIISELSPSIQTYTSFTRGELIGKPVSLFYYDTQDRDIFLHTILEKGEVVDYELRLRAKDGRLVVTSSNSHIIFDAQGKPAGIEGSLRDITARKSAEEELRKSEENYRSLTERMSDILWTCDLEMNTTYVTPSLEKVLGFTTEERMKQPVTDQITPGTLRSAAEMLEDELQNDEHRDPNRQIVLDMEYYHKDGTIRHMESALSFIRNENGIPVGIQGLSRDITARTQAEKLSRQSEEKFYKVFMTTPDCVAITRITDGLFVDVNRGFEEITGWKRSEVIGTTSVEVNLWVVPADREFMVAELKDGRDILHREFQFRRKDGALRIGVYSARTLRITDDLHLIFVMQDITQYKEHERDIANQLIFQQALIDSIPYPVFTKDFTGRFVGCNRAYEREFSTTRDYLIGKTVLDLDYLPIEERRRFQDEDMKVISEVSRCSYEMPIVYADGETHLTLYSVDGFRLADGNPGGLIGMLVDITDRKQAEEALRRSEERYRTILDEMDEGYQEVDLEGNITFFNEAFQKISGYSKDELLGSNFRLYTAEDSAIKKVYRAFNQLYKTGIPLKNLEWNIRRKDGTTRTIDFYSSLSRDANDRPIGFRGIIRDITDSRRAEAALRESEERYRTILDEMEEGYQEVDLAGNYKFFNEAFLRIFGYSREEMLGTNFRIYSAEEETAEKVYLAYNQTYKTGVPLKNLEWDIKRKDGSIRTIDFYASLLRDANNNPIGFRGIVHDITDIKLAEAALRESEIRMRSVTDSAQDAILMMNPEGRISYWNPAAERILGYTSAEALGQNLHSFIAPARYLEAHRAAFPAFQQSGQGAAVGKTLDLEARRKDGKEISIQLSLSAIQINNSWHAVGIMRDITDRKLAEEQLREMNRILADETARANEMAEQADLASTAKSEFLANMSHEIRTPMNGVIGMTGLLLDTELTGDQRRYAETVRASAESLLSLINDILDFSKIEAGKLDMEILDFNLENLLDDFAAITALRAHDKGLEFLYSADRQVPVLLRGDPGRLRQVLINLAGNAIKFTHSGEVAIRVTLVDEESGGRKNGLHRHAPVSEPSGISPLQPVLLRFAVRDTGIGIPESKLDLIFDKFTQADTSTTRKYGGTGLGLAISKQLVQMMGGDIGVVSEEGKGSEFWFTARLGKQAEGLKTEVRTPSDFHNVKVLIVDDNSTNREILTTRLTSWGMRPDEAIDAPAALRSLQQAHEKGDPFRIAIIDMQMPGMDGEALGRAIKADPRLTDLRMLMLTSLGSRGDSRRLQNIGFSAYLNKPSRHQDLFNVLSMLLTEPVSSSPQSKTIITRHSARDLLNGLKKRYARVLLVEDNITNQQVALGILHKLGITADAAANGAEAVHTLETVPYDLVLMDLQMPVMDGLTATRTIRRWQQETGRKLQASAIPIIAMTAHAMQGDREKCLEAGMNDYLSKPLSPEALKQMLEKWLPPEKESDNPPAAHGADAEKQKVNDKWKTAIGKKSRIPVWDKVGMLKRMMNDEDLAGKILAGFLDDIPRQINSLKSFLNAGDVPGVERQAHTIKGASANIGGERLRAVAFEMEKSAKRGDLSAASAHLADLEEQFDSLKMEISNWKR